MFLQQNTSIYIGHGVDRETLKLENNRVIERQEVRLRPMSEK